MGNDIERQERTYTTTDISEMVGVAEPTVRKYALALEKAGYRFIKDAFGTRAYVEKDAMVIRQLKEIRSKTNMQVDQAALAVAAKHVDFPAENADDELALQRYSSQADEAMLEVVLKQDEQIRQLRESMEQLIEMNRSLMNRLEEERIARLQIAASVSAAPTGEKIASEVMQQVRMDLELLEAERNQRLAERDERLMTVLRELQEQKNKSSLWKRIFGG